MTNYLELLPEHIEKYIGEHDLYLQVFKGKETKKMAGRPPLFFVHGAYSGSWMWCKYIPHFVENGWDCYAMDLRSHYKSRVLDLSVITFKDYLSDLEEVLQECPDPPILVGFSMGGLICQKIAETEALAGMILIDSTINKEVRDKVPFHSLTQNQLQMIEPAPIRHEHETIDETEADITFQKRYYQMESAKVFGEIGTWIEGVEGISIDNSRISCPVLVIKSISSLEKETRGREEAAYFSGEYFGLADTTHTGLLMGTRHKEVVKRIVDWLEKNTQ